MNLTYSIALILVFLMAGCTKSREKAKYPSVIKQVAQIDMILMHCQNQKTTGEQITEWPSGDYYVPHCVIESPVPIGNTEKFSTFLETRPVLLKQKQRYLRTIERDGWYIAHIASNEGTTDQAEIAMGIMRAFAVKVGTTRVYYWSSW